MTSNRATGALLLTLAIAGGAPAAEGLPGVVGVRFGVHPHFDRLVVEIDEETPLFRVPPVTPDEIVLEVHARSPAPPPTIPRAFSRIRGLLFDDLDDGTRIRIRVKGPVRVFRLHGPARLVVDVADPGLTPFNPPEGTEAVLAPPPEEAVPEPAPVEAPPTEPEPAVEAPIVTRPPAEPTPPEPRRVSPPVERLPYPPPEPAAPSPYDRWLALMVWVGGPLLLAGAGLLLLRSRRGAAGEAAEARSPETITPDEVLRASDRIDLLEKRIDEEVRGRMRVEQRLGQMQEDMKVVRDRLNRLVRRGEPTA